MTDIPEKYVALAKEMIALFGSAGIRKASGVFEPDFRSEWKSTIHWSWEQGRHGVDMKQLRLFANVETNVVLNVDP